MLKNINARWTKIDVNLDNFTYWQADGLNDKIVVLLFILYDFTKHFPAIGWKKSQ